MALINGNYEFLFYTAIMTIMIFIIMAFYDKFHFTVGTIFWLTIFIAFHIFGELVHIGSIKLYDFWLLGHFIHYDNLVHFSGSVFVTFFTYNFLAPHLKRTLSKNKLFLGIILILIASGFGAINEIIELCAVVFLNAKGVGGYFNNAIDLVVNFLGATVASIYLLNSKKFNKKLIINDNKK